jgi:N-acetylneuraminic acid mutarotase
MIGETLVVAGGTYFVEPPPAPKRWIDTVITLAPGASAWTEAGHLEHPLGYAAAISTPRGIVLAGGADAERHYDAVSFLTLGDGRVHLASLPRLPQPCAYLDGAILGSTVYVGGGRVAPQSPEALRTFWALDLGDPGAGWRAIEPWPGPARMLHRMVALNGSVYVVSGTDLVPGADAQPVRRYLKDAYRYHPEEGWTRIADLAHPVAAAPAVAYGGKRILVFGGDDGSLAHHGASLGDAHPGFRRCVLCYDAGIDAWLTLQDLPGLPVTTSAHVRGHTILIPSGEDRPAHRTPGVLAIRTRLPR